MTDSSANRGYDVTFNFYSGTTGTTPISVYNLAFKVIDIDRQAVNGDGFNDKVWLTSGFTTTSKGSKVAGVGSSATSWTGTGTGGVTNDDGTVAVKYAGPINSTTMSLPEVHRREDDLEVRSEGDELALIEDGREVARATTPERATIDVLHLLGQRALQDSVGTIRLHAGAIERDGRAVLLVGESDKGKSTLTAVLVTRGWGYLSDELAIVDTSTRTVVP
jgi:hypothetical protein